MYTAMKRIGVFSLQGSVTEHVSCLERAGAIPVQVNTIELLKSVDGLILPGGESTTLGILIREFGLLKPLRDRILNGMPVWGTCAGMILLAKEIHNQEQKHLGVMDIEVTRNGYGSQMESFKHELAIDEVSDSPIPLVFIRAPYINKVWNECRVLAAIDGRIIAARQKNMLATSFHPELTDDLSFYKYFLSMI